MSTPFASRAIAMDRFSLELLEPRFVLAADLLVESVVAPISAEAGAVIDVSWVVRNAGDEAAGGEFGWTDGLYLSADDVIDENDLYLGDFYADRQSIAPGETYTTTAQVVLPLDATLTAGGYRLIVGADAGDWLVEADEGNNAASSAVEVSIPALPDLSVLQVSAGPAAQAGAQFGDTITISWTIGNAGPGATLTDWADAVYLSTDGTLDENDLWVEVVEVATPGVIASGGSAVIEAVVRLPMDQGLAAGSYRLIVVADGYAMHPEADEDNNALASAPIEVAAPAPADLIVEDVVVATTGEFGDAITMTWTVRNTGAGSAAWWGDEVYLSADALLDAGDLPLGAVDGAWASGGTLAPGESVSMQATVRLPDAGALAAGNYHLLVQADAWGSVAESDEGNNVGASGVVSITDPGASDLGVESGVGPASGELGQTIEVSWVVKNHGAAGVSTWTWSDGVFLSLDGELSGEDVQVGWAEAAWLGAARLNPGETLAAGTTVWLPQDGSLQPGTYHIIIVADVNGQTLDANRANNAVAIATIEITGVVGGGGGGNWGGPEFGGSLGAVAGRGETMDNGGIVAGGEAVAAAGEPATLAKIGAATAASQQTSLYTWRARAAASRVVLQVGEPAASAVPATFVQ